MTLWVIFFLNNVTHDKKPTQTVCMTEKRTGARAVRPARSVFPRDLKCFHATNDDVRYPPAHVKYDNPGP